MDILFFATLDSFLEDITTHLGKTHTVIQSHARNGKECIEEILVYKPDIIWFEWCDKLLIEISQHDKATFFGGKNIKVICRLHGYEVFNDSIYLVKWDEFVDELVFVGEHMREIFESNVRINKTGIRVIYNTLDFEKLKPKSNLKTRGKNLACVGYINHKKNIPLLFYCYDLIKKYDPTYKLFLAGSFQDKRLLLYLTDMNRKLKLDVKFDGWIDDIPSWLEDKDYIFSPSLFEGFHYGCMEGIARGLFPIVHHWYGAETLYPVESLFKTPNECLEVLKKYESLNLNEKEEMRKRNIENIKRFAKEKELKKLDELINSLLE